ncbi:MULTISPECIES: flavin reductase [unclassified Pseudomonas]|uniref:flavin reductase n=1 Tax=unclassified Pseudomonas TaxID=196821 RepID=UPI002AC94DF5|nr:MULTISPECIES: flavin reductase [unclassified Pseudomonas]MEB0039300.1 flavin reductase [Pseudomonas sp. MH10]MEB0076052.1 flavin reductase [Pseudomonas sp. MH10out]MEB0090842.1 flavin reductase [Pseudomonas sp. CCI4.2]MEB0100147.1 flavin reductase [Pseudomonas sp. CCI3.2]MEB0119739.1 flavin reductase [Pseudomonas sp. CCI1.2]
MTTTFTEFDQRQLRNVLGTFLTGVTVVTTRDPSGKAFGVTANSFSSVSLDPPLVLWSQSLSSSSYPAFRDSDRFTINILADDQIAISNHFAKSQDDKFSSIAHSNGLGDIPLLVGAAAHLECTKVAAYPGGDHVVFLGRVEGIGESCKRPLAFGSGKYMVAYSHDLGPLALHLGTSTPTQMASVRRVIQELPQLAEEMGGHTLCLAVWGNHGPTAIYWEPSSQPVSQQLRLGLVMPVTQSATGRAFAAFLPDEMTKNLISEELRQYREEGEDAATQRERFEHELDVIRSRGFAQAARSQPSPLHLQTVNAFSVPIFSDGQMILALSVTSPAGRLSADCDGHLPNALTNAAKRLMSLVRQTKQI